MNEQDNLVSDQEKFTEALLKGSYSKALSIAHKYALSHDMIKIFYEQVVKPSLYRIGELWEYNQITVAAEHLATSLSESVMNELYENIISDHFKFRRRYSPRLLSTENLLQRNSF